MGNNSPPQQSEVKPEDLPFVECVGVDEDGKPCRGVVFLTGVKVRKVSALIAVPGSPVGKEGYINEGAAVCPQCWTVLPPKV